MGPPFGMTGGRGGRGRDGGDYCQFSVESGFKKRRYFCADIAVIFFLLLVSEKEGSFCMLRIFFSLLTFFLFAKGEFGGQI